MSFRKSVIVQLWMEELRMSLPYALLELVGFITGTYVLTFFQVCWNYLGNA